MPKGIPGSGVKTVPFQTQYTVLTGTQKTSMVAALRNALAILDGQVATAPSTLAKPVVRRRRRRNTTQIQQEQPQ